MSSVVNYIVSSSGTISLFITTEGGNSSHILDVDHLNHRRVTEELKASVKRKPAWSDDDVSRLLDLCSIERVVQKTVESFAEKAAEKSGSLVGTAELRNGQVYVNNVPVHNVISERILAFALKGLPVDPILRFLELLLENPSSRAQEELYDFLSNRALPLTEDGCFLAYKRVREDWYDIYSGTIPNYIGTTVQVPRDAVDDDRSHECARGLHVGALEYVRGYGSNGHVVIVKVNPRDCVSVPRDHNAQKLRVCKYEVLYEHDETKFLESPVYSTDGRYGTAQTTLMEEMPVDPENPYWEQGWEDDSYDASYDESNPWDDEDDYGDECECEMCVPPEEDEEVEDNSGSDLEGLTLDELANLARDRGHTATRQQGRDLGRASLIKLLS